jgi:outer membrane protein OmpA-like peptidoglycan-associated protein/ABC-type nitrate/sulfonate/bicarbonate transport system substrate-binding protein
MGNVKLKPASKILLVLIIAGAGYGVYHFFLKDKLGGSEQPGGAVSGTSPASGTQAAGGALANKTSFKVALSEWPGHMALVVGNGGLTTQPGSPAAEQGLQLEIVFIEDPVKKNAALQSGQVDFVWQVVDEMPINMGGYKNAGVDARAFLQIDWSRGGDACVASKEVKKVEDILGRKSAMMMFSPDHTVFEFMINNSRLTPAQIAQVRKDTSFSMDDFTYGRVLFTQGKVDVACLWEPDVTLALKGRAGSHRLFSTADATELVADVLLANQTLLNTRPEIAEKVARTWFGGVKKALADRQAAARLVSTVVPRFRDELGLPGTLGAFGWVKWTDVADNARFFGLDGNAPAFDRVYNQADSIWTKYPEAKITDRFTPQALRNDAIVRKIWQAAGAAAVAEKPTYEPKVAQTGKAVFTKPVTINFATGQSELDAESMHILNNQVMPQLEMAKGMYVRVEGNTDNVGSAAPNRLLSERRAKAVVDFLVGKGVDPQRITGKGNGDTNPVASNKTADGRAANRRTDILFISGQRS